MNSNKEKHFRRLATLALFVFDLYWFYFLIAGLFLTSCFFASDNHCLGVFLVGAIQFGILGYGSNLVSKKYKPVKELIKNQNDGEKQTGC